MNHAIVDRVPPFSNEAEQSVLGVILLNNNAIDNIPDLKATHFYYESHAYIFEAMTKLSFENKPVDLVLMQDELKNQDRLQAIGGLAYLGELAGLLPTSTGIKHYAKIVMEKHQARKLIKACQDTISGIYGHQDDLEGVLRQAEGDLGDALNNETTSNLVDVASTIDLNIQRLQDIERGIITPGIPSGFNKLDEVTQGFRESELIVISARPSKGKTAFVVNIAVNCALRGLGVFFASLEMSEREIKYRMIYSLAKVNSYRANKGFLRDDEWQRIIEATEKLRNCKIIISDKAQQTPNEILAGARRAKRMMGRLDICLMDYIQIGGHSEPKSASKENKISSISSGMKKMAKDMRVPVVALSQLNRDIEKRNDKRPKLADLRDSGAIEQDADIVIFIHREDKVDEYGFSETELIVAKNRNGGCDSRFVNYLPSYTLFQNIGEE